MGAKLIRLEDGTLVEVDVPQDAVQRISGGMADKVKTTFDKMIPLLKNICRPVVSALNDIGQGVAVEQAEIQVGFTFEAEGNLYVTKSKGGANLNIRLLIKPRN